MSSELFEFPEGTQEFTPEEQAVVETQAAILRRAGDRADVMGQSKTGGFQWWFLLGSWLRASAREAVEIGASPQALEFAKVLLEGDVQLPDKKAAERVWNLAEPKQPPW